MRTWVKEKLAEGWSYQDIALDLKRRGFSFLDAYQGIFECFPRPQFLYEPERQYVEAATYREVLNKAYRS